MSDQENVVEFPETMMLQWRPYERMLRETFNGTGRHPPAAIDDMLGRLRPIFLKHARVANEHPDAQAGAGDPFEVVQAWVAQLTMGLLLEISQREGRLMELGVA
jgi:hypothetical protein